jgi:hypothetical protein
MASGMSTYGHSRKGNESPFLSLTPLRPCLETFSFANLPDRTDLFGLAFANCLYAMVVVPPIGVIAHLGNVHNCLISTISAVTEKLLPAALPTSPLDRSVKIP